jgi:probable HAF family extracellular repeat protein
MKGETSKMKSRKLMCVAVTFAVVAISLPITAQDKNAQHRHYKLIDVGTFGGPNSGVSSGLPQERFLSKRGTVVGTADTPNVDPFSPNCFTDCFVTHGFLWHNGQVTDLGALPGAGNSGGPYASNDRGQYVGASENGLIDPQTGFPEVVAVLWTDGAILDLGTLGGTASTAENLNNRGQVVGAALNPIPDSFGADLLPYIINNGDPFSVLTQVHAFLWENGAMRDLGTLGGSDSTAQFVNDRGQVAGESFLDSTPNPPITAPACSGPGVPTQHPFVWQDGFIDLGSLGGTCGYPNWLTNRGQVVGTMTLAGDTVNHAFLWDRGTLIDLGTLGGNNSEAWFANDAGHVVGRADFSPTSTNHHAFLWRHGVMRDLGTVAGQMRSTAFAINSNDQVVGDANGNAWLWENGTIVDLNTLVPPASEHVAEGAAINDRGEIVATGLLANGDEHTVVLIPCDENHPGIEDCDYSLVEGNTTASVRVDSSPSADAPPLPRAKGARRGYQMAGPTAPPN